MKGGNLYLLYTDSLVLLFLGNLVWDNASSKFEVNLNPGLDGEDIKTVVQSRRKTPTLSCQLFKYLIWTFRWIAPADITTRAFSTYLYQSDF